MKVDVLDVEKMSDEEFENILELTNSIGPITLTENGIDKAKLISIEEYERMKENLRKVEEEIKNIDNS